MRPQRYKTDEEWEKAKANSRNRYHSLSLDEKIKNRIRNHNLRKLRIKNKREEKFAELKQIREKLIKSLDQIEIAWAAGFWEGEGSVGTRHFTACQNTKWPLERLQKIFGGKICGPRISDGTYQWYVCGEKSRIFGEAILYHLSPRRIKQINSIFKWQPDIYMPSNREINSIGDNSHAQRL